MTHKFAIKELMLLEDPDRPTIFVVTKPSEKEKEELLKTGIDEHALTSALDPDELARMEIDDPYTTILCKTPLSHDPEKPFQFEVSSLGIFLFKDQVFFVSPDTTESFHGIKVKSHLGLVFKILAKTVVHFREHLRAIRAISDSLQTEIYKAVGNEHLISLFSLQKSLVYYVDSLTTNGVMLDRLKLHANKMKLQEEEMELLDYLIIENAQCCKQAEIYSNILASLMDARASVISNNLNALMKTLNVITISIMVPTFVVSAFSMNVMLPGNIDDHWFSFFLIMGLSLFSALGFIWWWKRKHT